MRIVGTYITAIVACLLLAMATEDWMAVHLPGAYALMGIVLYHWFYAALMFGAGLTALLPVSRWRLVATVTLVIFWLLACIGQSGQLPALLAMLFGIIGFLGGAIQGLYIRMRPRRPASRPTAAAQS